MSSASSRPEVTPTTGDPSLGTPGFGAFLVTQFLGAFNDNAFRFALIFTILAAAGGDDDGSLLGAAQALFALPFVLLAAWAGALADRLPKSRLIVLAKVAEIVVMGAGVVAFAGESMGGLLVVLFLMSTQSTFFGPAKYGWVAETVPEAQLSRANGLVQLTTNLAIVGGQAAGGLVYETYAPNLGQGAIWFVGIALLGTVSSLFVPKVPASRPDSAVLARPVAELREVWGSVRKDPRLLYAMLGIGHFWMLSAVLQIDLADLGTGEFGLGETYAAALVASAVVGVGLGASLAGRWSEGRVELGLVPLGALTMSLGVLALALAPAVPLDFGPPVESGALGRVLRGGLWLPLLLTLGMGAAGGLFIVPIMALVQLHAPALEKGRYLAFANMVSFVGIFLAALFLWLPRTLGVPLRGQLLVAALLSLAGTVVSLRLLPDAFVRLVGWLLAHTFYRIRVHNPQHVPERGGALLVVNHVSWVDALILQAATRRKLHYLMYREYYEWGPTHWLFKMMGCIPVAGGDAPEVVAASLRKAGEKLDEGRVVVIFAEGSLTRLGHMLPLRSGYRRIVEGRTAPIVPVSLGGLWGSLFSHERGRLLWKWPRAIPYPASVTYGAPLPPDSEPHVVRRAIRALSVDAWEAARPDRLPLHLVALKQRRRSLRTRVHEDGRKGLSGASLMARSAVLAERLRGPLADATRVGLLAPPGQDAATAWLALARLGHVVVPLDAGDGADEIARRIDRAGVTHTLVRAGDEGLLPNGHPQRVLDADLADLPAGRVSWWLALHALLPFRWLASRVARAAPEDRRGPDAGCCVLFPRDPQEPPCHLSHENLLSTVEGLQQVLPLDRRRDGVLGRLRWTSAYGAVMTLWLPVLSGARVAWVPEGDGGAVGKAVARHALTLLPATPARLQELVDDARPGQLGSLRLALSGGEALPGALGEAFATAFGVTPLETLTATACAGLVALNTPDVRSAGFYQQGTRPGSVGHPLPRVVVDVREVDEPSAGAAGVRPVTGRGRLRVTGSGVAAAVEEDGSLRPRDGWLLPRQGWIDERGFLHLDGCDEDGADEGGPPAAEVSGGDRRATDDDAGAPPRRPATP